MWNDPIVEEIHAVRKRLWEEAGGDLHEVIRRACARHDPARVVVRGEPRRPDGGHEDHTLERANLFQGGTVQTLVANTRAQRER